MNHTTKEEWVMLPAYLDVEEKKIGYYQVNMINSNQHLCSVWTNEYLKINLKKAEANAKLIAQSPNMLEAHKSNLRFFKEWLNILESRNVNYQQLITEIKDSIPYTEGVINKATK